MTGDGSEWQCQRTQFARDVLDTIGVIVRGFSVAGRHARRCRADGRRDRARRPTHDRQAVAPRSRHRQRGRTPSTPPLFNERFQDSFLARHIARDSGRRPRKRGSQTRRLLPLREQQRSWFLIRLLPWTSRSHGASPLVRSRAVALRALLWGGGGFVRAAGVGGRLREPIRALPQVRSRPARRWRASSVLAARGPSR